MAPAKGNQHAVGKGRPPTLFSDEEAEELGKELLAWLDMKEEKGEPIWHLTDWSWSVKKLFDNEWEALIKRQCFVGYYDIARKRMASLLVRNKEMPQSYGNRFLAMYASDLRKFEREVKEETAAIEAAAKAKEVSNITPEEAEQNQSIVLGIVALQDRLKQQKDGV